MRPITAAAALACAAPLLVAAVPPARRGVDAVCEMRLVDRAHATSRTCLGCHDGSVGKATLARAHATPGGDHPVDVDYAAAFARSSGRLRAPNGLPPALPLVDGKVACTTCHDARSPERGRPAVTMSGSALCFACHDL